MIIYSLVKVIQFDHCSHHCHSLLNFMLTELKHKKIRTRGPSAKGSWENKVQKRVISSSPVLVLQQ